MNKASDIRKGNQLADEAKSLLANRSDVTAATVHRDPLWWKPKLKPLRERLDEEVEASKRKGRR